jgi:putative spermidine/putrescine transport system ATP-binding protein
VPDQKFSTLRLDGVSRSFGEHNALEGLDLTVASGEFVALLGPSGCGKSTALNCIAGLLPLTGGSIWLDERRIDGLPPERRGFGMVFQNYALFPHMTVSANVGFGLKMRKVPKAEAARRVDEALRMVQLEDQAAKYPGQLSGGQQQRVAIARAIVLEPPLVVMDEPLSNLDAKLRLEMRMEIRRLHQALGLTTVYVTHDQEEALSLADRLVVLRSGRVQQIGTPEQLYTEPVNQYVANFMGYRNMLTLDVSGADARAQAGSTVGLTGNGIRLTGQVREGLGGGQAVAAIRPDDVRIGTSEDNGIDVVVEVVEYHGRELAVQGRLPDGGTIHFRTDQRVSAGQPARLTVPTDRVLVYAGEPAAEPAAVGVAA